MSIKKISALAAFSLIAAPIALTSYSSSIAPETNKSSYRASRRMHYELAAAPLLTPTDPLALFAQQNCINEGTLQKTRDYVYLKLSEDYLAKIFQKIKEIEPAVRMARFKGETGPHISIIRHDEWEKIPIQKISELGTKYLFTPVRVEVIQTAHKKLWVLIVEPSAELMELRKKYTAGELPHGHEFHITLADQAIQPN